MAAESRDLDALLRHARAAGDHRLAALLRDRPAATAAGSAYMALTIRLGIAVAAADTERGPLRPR